MLAQKTVAISVRSKWGNPGLPRRALYVKCTSRVFRPRVRFLVERDQDSESPNGPSDAVAHFLPRDRIGLYPSLVPLECGLPPRVIELFLAVGSVGE
jgi:hypothetical protein